MKDLRICTCCANIYEQKEYYEAQLCFECQSTLYQLKKELNFSYYKQVSSCNYVDGFYMCKVDKKMV